MQQLNKRNYNSIVPRMRAIYYLGRRLEKILSSFAKSVRLAPKTPAYPSTFTESCPSLESLKTKTLKQILDLNIETIEWLKYDEIHGFGITLSDGQSCNKLCILTSILN